MEKNEEQEEEAAARPWEPSNVPLRVVSWRLPTLFLYIYFFIYLFLKRSGRGGGVPPSSVAGNRIQRSRDVRPYFLPPPSPPPQLKASRDAVELTTHIHTSAKPVTVML